METYKDERIPPRWYLALNFPLQRPHFARVMSPPCQHRVTSTFFWKDPTEAANIPSLTFSHRGLCLLKMGKLDAALLDFSKACELEPTAAVYHYQKASLLHHRLER